MYRNAAIEGPSQAHNQHPQNFGEKFGRVVFEIHKQTDKHTHMVITILCTISGSKKSSFEIQLHRKMRCYATSLEKHV